MSGAEDEPSSGTRKAGREERYELKREAILHAAAKLFNENGYETTSLSVLAKSLNITKPTLYHYIDSKDQLLLDIQRRGYDAIHAALEQASQSSSPGLDKLALFIQEYISLTGSDFGQIVIQSGQRWLSEESQKTLNLRHTAAGSMLEQIIEEGIDDGSIEKIDPHLAANFLYGALNWITYWRDDDGPLSPREVAEKFVQILRYGLVPR